MRVGCNCSEVLDNLLCAFCLPGPRLARDKDALIFALLPHVHPRTLRNCKDVWWILITPVRTVLLYYRVRVEREVLVRIDGDEEKTGVCLWEYQNQTWLDQGMLDARILHQTHISIASCGRHWLRLRTSSLRYLQPDQTLEGSSWIARTMAGCGSVLGPVE